MSNPWILAAAMLATASAPAAASDAIVRIPDSLYMTETAGPVWTGLADPSARRSGASIMPGVDVAAGAAVTEGFRLQADYAYLPLPPGVSAPGAKDGSSAFLSLRYDVHALGRIMPYVGVGMGVRFGGNVEAGGCPRQNGSVAFQGIIGASWEVPGLHGVSLVADYSYTGGFSKLSCDQPGTSLPPTSALLLGAKFSFGAQAPQEAPTSLTEYASGVQGTTYEVDFDWDESQPGVRGRQVVAAAAGRFRRGTNVSIEVADYADTKSGVSYRQMLGARRCESVAILLQAAGVPPDRISIQAPGASVAPGPRITVSAR